jgi:hypothetical protein
MSAHVLVGVLLGAVAAAAAGLLRDASWWQMLLLYAGVGSAVTLALATGRALAPRVRAAARRRSVMLRGSPLGH